MKKLLIALLLIVPCVADSKCKKRKRCTRAQTSAIHAAQAALKNASSGCANGQCSRKR